MKKRSIGLIVIAIMLVFNISERVYADLNDGLVAYYSFNGNALKYQTINLKNYSNYFLAEASYFTQHIPRGYVTLGNIPFDIPYENESWSSCYGNGGTTNSVSIDIGISNVTEVHTLINTFWGRSGSNWVHIECYGDKGAYYKKDLIGGIDIRDWANNEFTNSTSSSSTMEVWGDGYARIDKQTILLPSDFSSQTLLKIKLSDDGYGWNQGVYPPQRSFIAGLTVATNFAISPYLDISAITSPQQVNMPFSVPVTITAKDANANTNTGFNGEVLLGSPSRQVSPSSVKLVNGTKTVSVTVYTPGLGIALDASGCGLYGKSNVFDVTGNGLNIGMVKGYVKDLYGSPVPYATVYLENDASNNQTITDQSGYFEFSSITCGTYDFWATMGSSGSEHYSVDITDQTPVVKTLTVVPCAGKTPILLIPGIMGSSDGNGYLYPTLPKEAPAWNSSVWNTESHGLHDPFKASGWRNMIDTLASYQYEYGCSVFAVPYDWRRPLNESVENYLIPAINNAKAKTL